MGSPFISRQDLSDYLGRDMTADDGATIAVDSACDMVRTLAEQDFDGATDTITLDGTGTDSIVLPQLPVTGAGTVVVRGGTVDPQFYSLGDNGMIFRTAGTSIAPFQALGQDDWGYGLELRWPRGRQNIKVTYDHGYGTADFPADVRMVALSIAARLVVQGGAIQESIGPTSIRYSVNANDLTSGEKMIIAKYRQLG